MAVATHLRFRMAAPLLVVALNRRRTTRSRLAPCLSNRRVIHRYIDSPRYY